MVEARLVKHCNTKVFLLSIRLGHLEESVNLTDSRDVVGNEWLDLGLELNLLRLVPLDVIKHVFELLGNGQVRILVRVVGTWHLLLVLVVLVILSLRALLHLLLHVLLTCLLLLLLLSLGLDVDVDIDLVFFLIRVYLFGIVDIHRQVKWLILHFVPLHISSLSI